MKFTMLSEDKTPTSVVNYPWQLAGWLKDQVDDFVDYSSEVADHAVSQTQAVSFIVEDRDEFCDGVYRDNRKFRYCVQVKMQKMPLDEYLEYTAKLEAANDNAQLDLFDDYPGEGK